MLSREDMQTLETGDVIEAGPLLAGLSAEPLRLEVTAIVPEPFQLTAKGTYFGVTVGLWAVTLDPNNKPLWRPVATEHQP